MTNIIKNRNTTPVALGNVLDQLFPKNVTALLDDAFWGLGNPAASPFAPVNIREKANGYELELAAPGLHKSDFRLQIDGDTLTISCGKKDDDRPETTRTETNTDQKQQDTGTRWVRREFARPAFQRHFELEDTIDREKISARYDNGILSLALPKKEDVRPASRQIDIG